MNRYSLWLSSVRMELWIFIYVTWVSAVVWTAQSVSCCWCFVCFFLDYKEKSKVYFLVTTCSLNNIHTINGCQATAWVSILLHGALWYLFVWLQTTTLCWHNSEQEEGHFSVVFLASHQHLILYHMRDTANNAEKQYYAFW